VSSTWGKVSTAYQQVAADGHGGEFIGRLVGQGAVIVGMAVIPGGAEAEAVAALGNADYAAEVAGDLGKAGEVAGDAGKAEAAGEAAVASKSTELPLKVSDPGAQPTTPPGPKNTPTAQPETYPEGLTYRVDLPDYLSGPDGFKGGKLNGTHNEQNAITELQGQGATYSTTPTNTPGVNELNYQVTNSNTGKPLSGAKTTYDPAIYSHQKMLDMAQQAEKRAFEVRKADPTKITFDLNEGGVNFRIYINIDKRPAHLMSATFTQSSKKAHMDFFQTAFGGFAPQTDPDAAVKFCLQALAADHRLLGLVEVLTEGDDIGSIEGVPGWSLERRDDGNMMHDYAKWPLGAKFRAFVDPQDYELDTPERFYNRAEFTRSVQAIVDAYLCHYPDRQTALEPLIAILQTATVMV